MGMRQSLVYENLIVSLGIEGPLSVQCLRNQSVALAI
jgi:hypothetical protein